MHRRTGKERKKYMRIRMSKARMAVAHDHVLNADIVLGAEQLKHLPCRRVPSLDRKSYVSGQIIERCCDQRVARRNKGQHRMPINRKLVFLQGNIFLCLNENTIDSRRMNEHSKAHCVSYLPTLRLNKTV